MRWALALALALVPSSLHAAVLGNIGYDTSFVARSSLAAMQNLGNGTFSNGERVTGIDIRVGTKAGTPIREEIRSFMSDSNGAGNFTTPGYITTVNGEYVYHFDFVEPFIPDPAKCYMLLFYQFFNAPTIATTTFYGWSNNQYTASTTGCHPSYASHNINTSLQNPALNGHGMVDYAFQIHTESIQEPPVLEVGSLRQFRQFGVDEIAEGATFVGNAAVFKGTIIDIDSAEVKLEVELKPIDVPFDGSNTKTSYHEPAGELTVAFDELIVPLEQVPEDGQLSQFHWSARAVDDDSLKSEWQEFGTIGNTDFTATYTLGQAAADLAKTVVLEKYLLAGKGWDMVDKLYVASDLIKTGYHALETTVLSKGLDCSGLVMWTYNKIVNSTKSFDQNYITDLVANDQFESRIPITESDLLPGDLLFFDWDFSGRVDHVVMYVGGNPEANLVHARDVGNGIQSAKLEIYKGLSGFVGFGRPQNTPLAFAIKAHSPVHLSVTDPDGVTIDHTSVIASDTEYVREAGDMRYTTIGVDENGNPEDMVYSKVKKDGDYKISVTPIPGAAPNETYSLEFTSGDQTVMLAEDVPLSNIPMNGYEINVGTNEEISIVKTMNPIGDTYVKSGSPNKNQGTDNLLRVRAAGDNRALLKFDMSDIPTTATVSSAKLVLNIANNKDNWGVDGRSIGAYSMLKDWTELGATWNCGIDANTSNSSDKDCNGTKWTMGKPTQPSLWPYRSTPTATTTITNGQLGTIELDVTSDVQSMVSSVMANNGWLIRKEKEGKTGQVEFSSRETSTKPQLMVTYK